MSKATPGLTTSQHRLTMYNTFRVWTERVLRIPSDPEPPPGDESTARVFRAAPNYYNYLLIIWAISTLGMIAGFLPLLVVPSAIVFHGRSHHHLLLGFLLSAHVFALTFLAVTRLFSLALVRLNFEKRWYVVSDRSLRIREGILIVREMTVTFANIQNISISQGPIQRAIGIADLRVDTAGGGGGENHGKKQGMTDLHTAWFRGVNNANEIRALIQERLRQLKDSGLGDREEMMSPIERLRSTATPQILAALREISSEASRLRAAVAG